MRKGRSSRRSRVSRPSMTPASSKSMLTAETSTPSIPNVVIGVTPSPSSVSEIPSATAKAEAVQLELPVTPSSPPVAVAPVRDTLMAPAMPESHEDEDHEPEPASEERVRVAEKLEAPIEEETAAPPPVEEKIEAKVDEPKVAEPKVEEPKVEAAPVNLHDTIIDAQKIEIVKADRVGEAKHDDGLSTVGVDAKRPAIEEPVAAVAVVAKADAKPNFEKTLPFGSSAEETKAAVEARAEEAPKDLPPALAQDEETIPPAGDLAVAEQFFSEADVSRLADPDDDLDSIENEKAQRKSDPAVVQRRAKFAKYVTWTVGVSAALCLVAVAKIAFTSSSKTISAANAANAPAKTEMVVKTPPPPAAAPAAPAAKAAEPAAAAVAPAEPAKPVVTGDVKEEKAKVKAALDKNKLADAIEAGERAVAIDETDSEAWLLLGAAYHAKGELKEAQRAYHACVDKGTKDKFQRECKLFAR
jgi:tetratricopeptide (TPR) repeat protein